MAEIADIAGEISTSASAIPEALDRLAVSKPRGSIYPYYGIRPQKNHPYFGFGDLIP